MKHFIITRFNLKNKQHLKNNLIVNPNSLTWLESRFKVFEAYCLPSVKNQSNQDFEWCVCFDTDTPEYYKNKIKVLTRNHKNYHILFVDGFPNLKKDVIHFISSQIKESDRFIITSRLDNDDILHKDFIRTIQSKFVEHHNTIIDLNIGYQLLTNTKQKEELLLYKSKLNPFISLIEKSNSIKTILNKQHNQWDNSYNKINYKKTPLWIQLIHNENILNKKLNYLKKIKTLKNYKHFGLKSSLDLEDNNKIVVDNISRLPIIIWHKIKLFIKSVIMKQH
jgi:hypothetical protein